MRMLFWITSCEWMNMLASWRNSHSHWRGVRQCDTHDLGRSKVISLNWMIVSIHLILTSDRISGISLSYIWTSTCNLDTASILNDLMSLFIIIWVSTGRENMTFVVDINMPLSPAKNPDAIPSDSNPVDLTFQSSLSHYSSTQPPGKSTPCVSRSPGCFTAAICISWGTSRATGLNSYNRPNVITTTPQRTVMTFTRR